MNFQKQIIIGLLAILLFFSIYEISKSFHTEWKENKKWVYLEMVRVLNSDTTYNFYYGQINESIIDKIDQDPEFNGLFLLSEIRYWNNDDLLEVYADDNQSGSKLFGVRDIRHMNIYNKDPIYSFEIDELHENAKKLR